MTAPKVRTLYKELDQISAQFAAQNHSAVQTIQSVKGALNVLRNGDWVGKGAEHFYAEMDGDILPALNRLEASLQQASKTTLQIKVAMQEAEAEAARILDWRGGTDTAVRPSTDSAPVIDIPKIIRDIVDWVKSWFNSPTETPTPTPKLDPRGPPVSEEQGKKIFDDMKDESDIAFNYPKDGCYARAHLMAQRIKERYGINTGKAWAFGHLDPKVDYKGEPVMWGYHVAPVIQVNRADGTIVDMVIDPSISSKPLTVDEWKNLMNDPRAATEVTDPGKPPTKAPPYYKNAGESSGYWLGPDPSEGTDEHAKETMENYKKWGDAEDKRKKGTKPMPPATPEPPK